MKRMGLFSRMAYLGLCLLALAAALPARAAQHASSEPPAIENSVVKIFATMRFPDPFKPWTKQAPTESEAPPAWSSKASAY